MAMDLATSGKIYKNSHIQAEVMKPTICDAKGRIYLPEDVRKKYGTRFFVVPAGDKILLFPLVDDPVKDFAELGKKLPQHMTVAELKADLRKYAEEQSAREHDLR